MEELKQYNLKNLQERIEEFAKEKYDINTCEFGVRLAYNGLMDELSSLNNAKRALWKTFNHKNYLSEQEASFVLEEQFQIIYSVGFEGILSERVIKRNGNEFRRVLRQPLSKEEVNSILSQECKKPIDTIYRQSVDKELLMRDIFPQMSIVNFNGEYFVSEGGLYKAIQSLDGRISGKKIYTPTQIAKKRNSLLEDRLNKLIRERVDSDVGLFQHLYEQGRINREGRALNFT